MKVLLLDADGVVLVKGEYFSEKYAREYNVPIESVLEFFKGPYVECQRGESDLKEVILPYLDKWGWQGNVDGFLTYWFASDIRPNQEIEETLAKFRAMGVRVYLASNNEKYRAREIEEVLTKLDLLDGFYFSSDIKARKENPDFFKFILNDLAVDSKDVVFIDNDQKNVDGAKSVGIASHLYHEGLLAELLQESK